MWFCWLVFVNYRVLDLFFDINTSPVCDFIINKISNNNNNKNMPQQVNVMNGSGRRQEVTVPDYGVVGDLKNAIQEAFNIPTGS